MIARGRNCLARAASGSTPAGLVAVPVDSEGRLDRSATPERVVAPTLET